MNPLLKRARLHTLLASVLYTGYMPWIPGTFGSLFGLAVALAIGENLSFSAILIALLFLSGVRASKLYEDEYGLKDDRRIVIDELVGMLIALWGIKLRALNLLMSFVIFRLLDVLKPFPARRLERLPGGWGVMLDDLVAGVYTNLLLRVCIRIVPVPDAFRTMNEWW